MVFLAGPHLDYAAITAGRVASMGDGKVESDLSPGNRLKARYVHRRVPGLVVLHDIPKRRHARAGGRPDAQAFDAPSYFPSGSQVQRNRAIRRAYLHPLGGKPNQWGLIFLRGPKGGALQPPAENADAQGKRGDDLRITDADLREVHASSPCAVGAVMKGDVAVAAGQPPQFTGSDADVDTGEVPA